VNSGKQFRVLKTCNSNDTQYSKCIAYRLLSAGEIIIIGLVLLTLGLTGCNPSPTPYRPPAITFHTTSTPLGNVMPTSISLAVEKLTPIATPFCTYNLTFLEDITIPNGTTVTSGDSVDKRWLVQNSGSCNWDERYRLRFVSGSELDAPLEQALYPARSGTKASIWILFTAPSDPGTYQSTWQAYDPQGETFGDPLFVRIVVDSGKR